MLGAVLQKSYIPPSFYPLGLITVISYCEVDLGSYLRGKVKAKVWKLVHVKLLFNLEENSTSCSVLVINPMIFFLNSCCHLE